VTARGILTALLASAALAVAGCVEDRHDASGDRRAYSRLTKEATLVELEKALPGSGARLARAAGWAAFGEGGAAAFGGKQGDGFGVAYDNESSVETFMKMRSTDVDPFRLVIVFDDKNRFRAFVAKGGSLEAEQPPGVEVYRLVDGALAPPSVLAGTTFAPDRVIETSK